MFGPILTTGVALSAAVVVVTNPVTAPQSDVRIPAAQAQVSPAGGEAVDMLDEDFINAVAPRPAGSNNPLAILKDLVSVLVADATDLGRNAILRAFVAGASVVSGQEVPELTAVSRPYLPYLPPTAPEALPVLNWPVLSGPVPEELRPVFEQALTAIIADSGELADPTAVAAAFIAGVALAAEDSRLLTNLRGLFATPLPQAVDNDGPAAPVLPRTALGAVIRDTVRHYLPALPPVSDLPADSGAQSPTDLLAGGAPAGTDDTVATTIRQPRPTTVDRGMTLLGLADVDAPVPAVAPPRTVGPGPLGAAVLNRVQRPDVGESVRGSIGRAIKAHADRTRD